MATQSKIYSGNVLPLRPRIKQAAKVVIESLPMVGDLFHSKWVFPRTQTACLGVFTTFEEARAAADNSVATEYDACNENRSLQDDISRDYQHDYEDYPVLFWLKGLLRPGIRIADLGGSTGGTFYAFEKVLGLPGDATWSVAELPAAVKKGLSVAQARGEPRIRFVTRLNSIDQIDVLLTVGTLQYIPETLDEIISGLSSTPPNVIVHKVPTTDEAAFWTVQNLGIAQVPYYVYNRQSLIESMAGLGYRLVDSCDTLRSIRMPFNPTRDVHHYSGFFFEKEGSAASR
jgi:putative methyltransferase (TIGR04325 family)